MRNAKVQNITEFKVDMAKIMPAAKSDSATVRNCIYIYMYVTIKKPYSTLVE